jgi:hypothetical protein
MAALPLLGLGSAKFGSLAQALSLGPGQRWRWTAGLFLSWFIQMASIVEIWLLGKALGVATPLLAYAVVVPLVTLMTVLPISISGVGVREGGLLILLGRVGVPSAGAVALGMLWFCMLATASLTGGLIYLRTGFSRFPSNTPVSDEKELQALRTEPLYGAAA